MRCPPIPLAEYKFHINSFYWRLPWDNYKVDYSLIDIIGLITMFKYALLFIVTFAIPVQSFAAHCYGEITSTRLHKNGNLYLQYSFSPSTEHKICSMDAVWNDVSVEVCKGWLSLAQTAKVAKLQVAVFYDGITAGNGLSACENIPTIGSAPAPHYIKHMPD